jgi:hypothetical protein
MIDIFNASGDGGYVFSTVHNNKENVSADKMTAMIDVINKYR